MTAQRARQGSAIGSDDKRFDEKRLNKNSVKLTLHRFEVNLQSLCFQVEFLS